MEWNRVQFSDFLYTRIVIKKNQNNSDHQKMLEFWNHPLEGPKTQRHL